MLKQTSVALCKQTVFIFITMFWHFQWQHFVDTLSLCIARTVYWNDLTVYVLKAHWLSTEKLKKDLRKKFYFLKIILIQYCCLFIIWRPKLYHVRRWESCILGLPSNSLPPGLTIYWLIYLAPTSWNTNNPLHTLYWNKIEIGE